MRKPFNSSRRAVVLATILAVITIVSASAVADPVSLPTEVEEVATSEAADDDPEIHTRYSAPATRAGIRLESEGANALAMQRAALRARSRTDALLAANGPYAQRTYIVSTRSAARLGTVSPSVEKWRPLVSRFFPSDRVIWALRIMACESGGDPNITNRSSGAAGLFQFLPHYWAVRAEKAGFSDTTPYDPTANVATAAWLLMTGGESHWECKASKY